MLNFIGFAAYKLFDTSEKDLSSRGWYCFLYEGTLYSQDGHRGTNYNTECKIGDTFTCIYNASTSEISYEKNGVSLGVAFTNVKGDDIAPAVGLYYDKDCVILHAI
jgi:SPRY domain